MIKRVNYVWNGIVEDVWTVGSFWNIVIFVYFINTMKTEYSNIENVVFGNSSY